MATDALRSNDMMAHLLGALDRGEDIGHYGRLTFAMVARHFMSDDPDACNVYRNLQFPDGVYENIQSYHEQKAQG